MTSAAQHFSRVTTGASLNDEDLGMVAVASALRACQARGADRQTLLNMCERLLNVAEQELLERERRMMASGDPELAAHVRRHGDLLFALTRQLRESRRSGASLSKGFIQRIGTMVDRIRTAGNDTAS